MIRNRLLFGAGLIEFFQLRDIVTKASERADIIDNYSAEI